MMMNPTAKTLVLLDIDGTLLWSGGAGSAALRLALEAVYGTHGILDQYDPGGRTVQEIVDGVLQAAGFTQSDVHAKLEAFYKTLEEKLRWLIASDRYQMQACPGALGLVDVLTCRENVIVGLLTGNPEATAIIKLHAAGFNPTDFVVGAFGNESSRRSELVQMVVDRASVYCGCPLRGKQIVILGDTVRDVQAGKSIQARTIAVATGGDPIEKLRHSSADAVFEDLRDIPRVIDAIFGSSNF